VIELSYFSGGLMVGALLAFGFFWQLGKDADAKYAEGSARWDAGTEEYRKAVQVLEKNRAEREQFERNVKSFRS
jgi:hypothetical protein